MISSVSSAINVSFQPGYGLARASASAATSGVTQLTPEQLQQVQQLAQTDRKVRAHEQAHLSAAADLVRAGPNFGYQTGPDNRQYAVSGEVSIDVSPASTPQETITKAQRIRAAALAPADPSAQDNRVAALASRLEVDAQIELATQNRENSGNSNAESSAESAAGFDHSGARLYREVAQHGGQAEQPGFSLDIFA